jgi:hypothetical protein
MIQIWINCIHRIVLHHLPFSLILKWHTNMLSFTHSLFFVFTAFLGLKLGVKVVWIYFRCGFFVFIYRYVTYIQNDIVVFFNSIHLYRAYCCVCVCLCVCVCVCVCERERDFLKQITSDLRPVQIIHYAAAVRIRTNVLFYTVLATVYHT